MNLEKRTKEGIRGFHINWKLKLAGTISSFGLGVGLGAISKHTSEKYIPAIPIVMDLIGGLSCAKTYLFYGAGVAMNYIPEIYQLYQNNF